MASKNNEKKIVIFNIILVLTILFLGIFVAKNSAVTPIKDIELADLASSDIDSFLSRDIYKEHGSTIVGYSADKDADSTIRRVTAACADPTHNYYGDASYTAKVIIDIDNTNGYTDANKEHSGLYITTAGGSTEHITDSDLVKRARFLAAIVKYIQYDGGFTNGLTGGNDVRQSEIDGFLEANIVCFANHAGLSDFKYSGFDDQGGMFGTGWQRATVAGIDYRTTSGIFNTATDYANNTKASGLADKSVAGAATYEYTDNATILGPYKIAKEGEAAVTGIKVKEKGGETYDATVLDANKNDTTINGMGNNTDFYIKVNKVIGEVETITVNGSGSGIIQARLILCEGAGAQRISIFGSKEGGGNISFNLTPPPLVPKIVKYKYIKSIQQIQLDGSYKQLFNITEVPKLTIKNAGKNTAEVTNVTYPDYSKYCKVDSQGIPYVNNRDIVEFAWVIYNIGPGDAAPGRKESLSDVPDKGYVLQKENGWSNNNGQYSKTITLNSTIKGYKGSGSIQYYTGSNTCIYLQVDVENIDKNVQYLYNNKMVPLKVMRPVIVKYKYIKSIKQLQKDGTYKQLFDINEIPKLTISNIGTEDAKVTKVEYPDYSKYCDVDASGAPYVYNGDLIEYKWVIYNIGPGTAIKGTQVTLEDIPDLGYNIQEGKENGWATNGSNFTKTITLKEGLAGLFSGGTPNYYTGSDTIIYLVVDAAEKLTSSTNSAKIYNNSTCPTTLTIKIAGKVFKDNLAQKDGREDGIISTGDKMLSGIEVVLFDSSRKQVAQTSTNNDGYYEFDKLDPFKSYYVRFKYNGQLYEPTTYQTAKKYTGDGDKTTNTTIAERSYATDGTQNRDSFNKKFEYVDANHRYPSRGDTNNAAFMIYAYTGSNGLQNLLLYTAKNTAEELQNVNFGIKDREEFDMNLRKDLVKVDVTINGKSHTYDYNGEGKDLEVTIRGTDIPDYERKLRKTDLQYKSAAQYDSDPDKLQVYVTYKIQIKNQSVGKITGYITDLNDYADTSYQLVNSYDENGKAINWSSSGRVSGNGKTYNKIHTTSIANEGITDKKWIFMQYKVSYDTLRELLSTGETLEENYAEIAGYRNTYTSDRYDLNGNKITNAGAVAGLLDIDSTPDNMNPTDSKVQNFVKESKTDAYQSLDGTEKTKRSSAVFEDDADVAPGLKLIRDDTERTISGTVFEDSPLKDKLKNNERIGDGEYKNGENIVNKVKVELLCQNNEDVDTLNKVETRSNTDGTYTLSGYIPGDYLIRFTYGDYECLINPQQNNQMYTGQDYKSTIYTEGDYKDLYWYNNTSPRKNDAVDDYDGRRQVVNSYSKDYKYDIAKVLNATRTNNSDLLATLAEKTYMTANTAKMAMEIEYMKNEKTSYKVQNVDFGIIERPRTKIVLDKRVSHIKLTATDGTTIFDTNQSTSNLTWKENKYNDRGNMVSTGLVQGTVDENLLYGSTLNVRYTLEIRNHSEVDYNEKSYYVTGVVSNRGTMNRIEPTSVIEYVPNVLQYDAELTKANGEVYIAVSNQYGSAAHLDSIAGSNNLWQVLASKRENKNLPDSYRDTLLEAGAFDEAKQTMDEILITNLDGVRNALARNDVISLRNALTLTRVIARTEDTSNADEIQNIAEVIRLTIDNGRRPYYEDTTNKEVVEIPGNTYPSTLKNIEEVDTGRAEVLTFVVPFGANRQLTLIVIAIVSLGLLVAGIVIIKKKVL